MLKNYLRQLESRKAVLETLNFQTNKKLFSIMEKSYCKFLAKIKNDLNDHVLCFCKLYYLLAKMEIITPTKYFVEDTSSEVTNPHPISLCPLSVKNLRFFREYLTMN